MDRILAMSQTFESEPPAIDALKAGGIPFDVVPIEERRSWGEQDLARALEGYTGLIAGGDFPITAAMVEACPSLKAVSLNCTGVNHVDVSALEARGIALYNTPGLSHSACADFIMGQMLALMRHIALGDRRMRAGLWDQGVERGLGVTGKTMGIIGLGSIGLDVCDRAKGFAMRVLASVRHPKPELAARHGFEYVGLDAIYREADILVISCPLTDETRGMVGRKELALMKPGAVLINSARGPIVDEDALFEALKGGRLFGAALDVFDQEPLTESRFFALDNVLLTPHLAGRADRQIEDCAVKAAENILAFYHGTEPFNRLL
jgi:D-3-phosphoglycerate dehydrogenase